MCAKGRKMPKKGKILPKPIQEVFIRQHHENFFLKSNKRSVVPSPPSFKNQESKKAH